MYNIVMQNKALLQYVLHMPIS